eukprot:snap_masked-scaffold_21-processed-gene-0.21-mRNA-1 protein AED:1.00 eAED:1.00 QI:0/-1/0/0/-1/1/1/0/83
MKYTLSFVKFPGLKYTKQLNFFIDNMGAILIASSERSLDRTKYIEKNLNVVEELINMGIVNLSDRNTNDLQADIFTKALGFFK